MTTCGFWPVITDGYGTPTPPLANLQLCFGLVLAAEKDMVNECVGIMTGPTQMNLRSPHNTTFFVSYLCLQASFVSRRLFLLPAVLWRMSVFTCVPQLPVCSSPRVRFSETMPRHVLSGWPAKA